MLWPEDMPADATVIVLSTHDDLVRDLCKAASILVSVSPSRPSP